MSYLGDIRLGDTIDFKFCTTAAATGAPTTLAGSPVISAYPGNSTTQLTAGITLTVDFDSVTGLHNVRVVASSGNGYATATNYEMVITTGTVGGTSAVGYVVGTFSIENRSAVMPTVATRTLDIASTGEAGLDINNIAALAAGPLALFGIVESGTAQSATGTTLVGRAAATDDSIKAGMTLLAFGSTQGYWQSVVIDSVSGDTFTIAAWPIATPSGTITYYILGTPQASSSLPTPANVTKWNGTTVATPATAGIPDVNAKNINNVATTSVTTINANQGTIQPVNFTGTGASALAKSDMVDIAGAAVSTSSAQIGVNAVNIGGTAQTGRDLGTSVLLSSGTGTGQISLSSGLVRLSATGVADIVATALTESYAADGAAGTLSQILFGIQAFLQERSVSGTTLTVKKLDGTTSAMTFTLSDATAPVSVTRAT